MLAGRYTVGEMRSLDGEGVLYSGVENLGGFRVTIKAVSYTHLGMYPTDQQCCTNEMKNACEIWQKQS